MATNNIRSPKQDSEKYIVLCKKVVTLPHLTDDTDPYRFGSAKNTYMFSIESGRTVERLVNLVPVYTTVYAKNGSFHIG